MDYKREQELEDATLEQVRKLEPTKTHPVQVIAASYVTWGRFYRLRTIVKAKKVCWIHNPYNANDREKMPGNPVAYCDDKAAAEFEAITTQHDCDIDDISDQIMLLKRERTKLRQARQAAYEVFIESRHGIGAELSDVLAANAKRLSRFSNS